MEEWLPAPTPLFFSYYISFPFSFSVPLFFLFFLNFDDFFFKPSGALHLPGGSK